MSYSVNIIKRSGAYEHPFSETGIEFDPLGVQPDKAGIILHETGYNARNSNWNFPSVLGPFWRVYYNHKRGHCIVFGDEFYELGPEHILLIPDHQMFHCLGQRPTPAFWVHFSFDRKPALDQSIPILLKPDETELNLIASLCRIIENGEKSPSDRIFHLSLSLLHLIVSRPEIKWRPALPDKLVGLIQYIEIHAEQKVPNQALAKQAGISVEGVYRLFRKHMGTTPANYINQIRIRKASHLLQDHDLSIEEVADRTGFPNRAYFSRVFKKITGISPGVFRLSRAS